MKRRFNSTGRKHIPSSVVNIRLVHPDDPRDPVSFDVDLSKLKTLGLPNIAKVYVEPYVTGSSSIMRFPFGTIDSIVVPADRTLSELDAGGRIVFRIKVVDESETLGRILAASNAIRPLDDRVSQDQQRSILPVETRDLGEAVWRLDMQDVDRPTLVLNSRIGGLLDRIKNDPFVQGAIVPHAVRQILIAILDPERADVTDDTPWVQDWKVWIAAMLGTPLDEDLDADLVEQRADDIVNRFVERWRFASRAEANHEHSTPYHE